MKNIKTFVEKYKDIFTSDSSHITTFSKKKIVFDIVKLVSIIITFATIILISFG